jgi:hypothetical protein
MVLPSPIIRYIQSPDPSVIKCCAHPLPLSPHARLSCTYLFLKRSEKAYIPSIRKHARSRTHTLTVTGHVSCLFVAIRFRARAQDFLYSQNRRPIPITNHPSALAKGREFSTVSNRKGKPSARTSNARQRMGQEKHKRRQVPMLGSSLFWA